METILQGEYIEVANEDIVLERETPKAHAIYVMHNGRKIFMWVPKSQTIKTENGMYVRAWVFNKNLKKGKVA